MDPTRYHGLAAGTAVLMLSGDVHINGKSKAKALDLVLFTSEGENTFIESLDHSQLLLLSGQPISEPVVQYRPFFMNTQDEIRQAVVDFNNGRFGYLED